MPDDPIRHLRGAAVLLATLLLLVLATPVADTTPPGALTRPEVRRAYLEAVGPIGWVRVAAAWVNRHGRLALVRWVAFVQRPLATPQGYSMYPAFELEPRWLEVWVDDRLVYRSLDPHADYKAWVFANPRIAYPMDVRHPRERLMARGLMRWLVEAARADFPDAARVTFTVRSGTTPDVAEPVFSLTSEAPEWRLARP